ncbi:alpha/beta fold hydrolase [Bacillus marasmi]|uniref:alpha/beta fold hydrolase n=1 Tax=Bacillus marasmi TaxID=1926279 RepID=UPI0011CA9D3C|nr:alpha/beta hydrolase [Bacillus marasmi]
MVVDVKEVNGINVYYEFHQSASAQKTMVLIHGFLSSSFSFRRLTPFLNQDYNVLLVDFPPFGKSGKTKKFIYTYENIASTFINLLNILKLDQVILVGHSMGGQISLHMAYQRPDFIESLVLLGSSSYLKPAHRAIRYSSYLPFFPIIVKRWLAKSGLLNNLQNVVYNQNMINEEMMNGYMEPFLNEDIFRGLTKLVRDREEELSSEILAKITTDSLLIWGEHDRVVPVSVGRRLHQDLTNSELIVLAETGHLVPEEKPDLVYNHIKDFLNKSS